MPNSAPAPNLRGFSPETGPGNLPFFAAVIFNGNSADFPGFAHNHIHQPISGNGIGSNIKERFSYCDMEFQSDGFVHQVNDPFYAYIPKGMSHSPLAVQRIGKRLIFIDARLYDPGTMEGPERLMCRRYCGNRRPGLLYIAIAKAAIGDRMS